MELLDIYLPHYHFRERHALDIRATAAQVMGAVESYDSTDQRWWTERVGITPVQHCLNSLAVPPS